MSPSRNTGGLQYSVRRNVVEISASSRRVTPGYLDAQMLTVVEENAKVMRNLARTHKCGPMKVLMSPARWWCPECGRTIA